MYKIKNISGYLSLLGLYPGESKTVDYLNVVIKDLYSKQLISIQKVPKNKSKIVEATTAETIEDPVVTDNLKDCEVINTNGRN